MAGTILRAGRLAVDCRLWAGQRKAHRSRAAHPSCCPCAVCRSSSGKSPGSRIPSDDAACTATAAQAGARLPCSLLQKPKQPHICGTRQRHVAHVPYLSALCTAPPPHIAALCTAPPPHIAARCAPRHFVSPSSSLILLFQMWALHQVPRLGAQSSSS